jgi:hypothetical protein
LLITINRAAEPGKERRRGGGGIYDGGHKEKPEVAIFILLFYNGMDG